MLTPYQQMALPVLLWFLDPRRHRGEGRTTLMAHAAIELAMRGYLVPLEDLSSSIDARDHQHRYRLFFTNQVFAIVRDHYREHLFSIRNPHRDPVLEYCGRRPK